MIKKEFKGVLFDLDGTLADTLDDIAGSMNRILNNHGYPTRPSNDYKLLVGRGLDNLVKQALPEFARQPEIINTCLHELIIDYDKNCLVNTHLYDGILDLLNELTDRNIKLAVFSNKAEPLTIKIVLHLLPDIPFVKISGARPDIPKKPDPAGALEISKIIKTKPEELVYMGDSDVDMMTAANAGMFAVGVSWGFRSRKELLNNGAAMIIDAPLQILELF